MTERSVSDAHAPSDDGLLFHGPDNHARWCSTEHDGACIDELVAKGERRAAERAEKVRRLRNVQ